MKGISNMSKKAKIKRKSQKRRKTVSKKSETMHIVSYEVTYDPIESKYLDYPEEIQNEIESLCYKAQESPKSAKLAIPRIQKLIEEYPSCPTLYNYLTVAYSISGNPKKSLFWIKETYRLFPDYLFARILFAQQYLKEDNLEKAMDVFDCKLDLKLLYPERNVFHITEVVSFLSLVIEIYFRQGKLDSAEKLFDILRELAPNHPQTIRLTNIFKHMESYISKFFRDLFESEL